MEKKKPIKLSATAFLVVFIPFLALSIWMRLSDPEVRYTVLRMFMVMNFVYLFFSLSKTFNRRKEERRKTENSGRYSEPE